MQKGKRVLKYTYRRWHDLYVVKFVLDMTQTVAVKFVVDKEIIVCDFSTEEFVKHFASAHSAQIRQLKHNIQ